VKTPENYNIEENVKKKKYQTKTIQQKNTVTELKNSIKGFNSRKGEERINRLRSTKNERVRTTPPSTIIHSSKYQKREAEKNKQR
jgi:hypothetical protein